MKDNQTDGVLGVTGGLAQRLAYNGDTWREGTDSADTSCQPPAQELCPVLLRVILTIPREAGGAAFL